MFNLNQLSSVQKIIIILGEVLGGPVLLVVSLKDAQIIHQHRQVSLRSTCGVFLFVIHYKIRLLNSLTKY
jgi:hypothetical protein